MVEATVRAALDDRLPAQDVHPQRRPDGRRSRTGRRSTRSPTRLGVPCFTRTDGIRGKAGNLNHAPARTPAASSSRSSTPTTSRGPTSPTTCSATSTRASRSSPRGRTSASTRSDQLGNAEVFFYARHPAGQGRATTRRSRAATASSTGAPRSRTSAASRSGTSSRTCTRPTSCTRAAGTASTCRAPVTTGTAPGDRRRDGRAAAALGDRQPAHVLLGQPAAQARADVAPAAALRADDRRLLPRHRAPDRCSWSARCSRSCSASTCSAPTATASLRCAPRASSSARWP